MPHEFNGEEYKKASTHQKEWGNKIIAEFKLHGNERILDLGCGDGVLTAELAALVPDGFVQGIDGSRSMIETASKLEKNNLSFKVQDINNLDYVNEFDVVFSNATLHWIKDHKRLLKYVYASLKPNGILRFNFGAEGNCVNFIRIIQAAMQLPEYAQYFSGFETPWYFPEPGKYEKLVKENPFREMRVWGENADRYFPDVASIVKWIDQPSLVPFLEVIPAAQKRGFRDYVVEKMIEATLQKDGTCFETFRRINVWARK
jgi:trans-aconitate 2-methyltransferase